MTRRDVLRAVLNEFEALFPGDLAELEASPDDVVALEAAVVDALEMCLDGGGPSLRTVPSGFCAVHRQGHPPGCGWCLAVDAEQRTARLKLRVARLQERLQAHYAHGQEVSHA